MKVLIVANKVPYPAKDGGAIATLNMALGLASAGADVTLLAINTIKHYSPINDIPEEITQRITIRAATLDTTIKPLAALKNLLFSDKPYNAERFESKKFDNLIGEELVSNTYDIIQLEGLYLAPYIRTIRQKSNAALVLRAHNLEHEIWERTAAISTNPLKKLYLKNLAKRILRMEEKTLNLVDAVIPITEKDAQGLKQWNPTIPTHVAPTGLNESQFAASRTEHPKQSLFHLGGLDWTPNQAGIIWFLSNCWTDIKKAVPNAKFFIAGRNAPSHFVKAIQHPGIEFLGEVDSAQQFMQAHGIMIVPLRSGSGMRIKIIEGMAASTPIISTAIGAEGINAENGKEIVIADSAEAITNACINLLQNVEVAAEIAQNGCNFARKHFSNAIISQHVMEFYEGLITNSINKNS